jgi:hypothetical protein
LSRVGAISSCQTPSWCHFTKSWCHFDTSSCHQFVPSSELAPSCHEFVPSSHLAISALCADARVPLGGGRDSYTSSRVTTRIRSEKTEVRFLRTTLPFTGDAPLELSNESRRRHLVDRHPPGQQCLESTAILWTSRCLLSAQLDVKQLLCYRPQEEWPARMLHPRP